MRDLTSVFINIKEFVNPHNPPSLRFSVTMARQGVFAEAYIEYVAPLYRDKPAENPRRTKLIGIPLKRDQMETD